MSVSSRGTLAPSVAGGAVVGLSRSYGHVGGVDGAGVRGRWEMAQRGRQRHQRASRQRQEQRAGRPPDAPAARWRRPATPRRPIAEVDTSSARRRSSGARWAGRRRSGRRSPSCGPASCTRPARRGGGRGPPPATGPARCRCRRRGRPALEPRAKRSKISSRSASGTPEPVVLDADLDAAVHPVERHPGDPAGVLLGVVEEVGQHLHQAAPVDEHDQVVDVGGPRRPGTGRPAMASRHAGSRNADHLERARAPAPGCPSRSGRSPTGRPPAPGSGRCRRPAGRAPATARSGISSRRRSSTSTEAVSVMSGERSSWLTSEAKRASRSTRSCRAEAMLLNELTIGVSCGVVGGGGRRVSSLSAAMASAARLMSLSGAERGPGHPAAQQERPRSWSGQHGAGQGHGQVVQRLLQVLERGQLEVRGADGTRWARRPTSTGPSSPQLEALDHRLAALAHRVAQGDGQVGRRPAWPSWWSTSRGSARPGCASVEEQARFAARRARQGVDDAAGVDVAVVRPRRSCRMLALKKALLRASDSRADSWLVRTTW